ncbi:MAG: MOSC domain-containing protein [Nannocystaceae bacterium]
MQTGVVARINVNPAGGVPKHAVPSAQITAGGVIGDRQLDLEHHGGPERAVSLYSVERIAALNAEGHPIAAGTAGENLTLAGIDWERLGPGARLTIGEGVILEITRPAPPCKTIAASFADERFVRISEKVHPGWSRYYCRVLREGVVRVDDPVAVDTDSVRIDAAE